VLNETIPWVLAVSLASRTSHGQPQLIRVAAVWPPWSLSQNSQFLRPTSSGRIACSLALLSIEHVRCDSLSKADDPPRGDRGYEPVMAIGTRRVA
jgi:hypothetical protein